LYITVKVAKDIVSAIQKKRSNGNLADQILDAEQKFGVALKPLHDDVNNIDLSTYFVIDVSNSSKAQDILTHLRRCKGIEAAYIKPHDSLPNSA
jgi:hypothetical protein